MGTDVIPYEPYHPHLGYTLAITCLTWLAVWWYSHSRLRARPTERIMLYALAIGVPLYAEAASLLIFLLRPAPDTWLGYPLSHLHAYVVNRLPLDTFLPLTAIWAAVGLLATLALLSAVRFMVGTLQLRAMLAPARPLAETPYAHLAAGFASLAAAAPGVLVLELDAPLAFTAGMVSARIVVTTGLLALLSDDELLAVLCHEWAHVRRRDNLWNGLVRVLRDMLFFLPGSHIAWHSMIASQDEACDRMATMMVRHPLALARALVKVSAAWQTPAAPTPLKRTTSLFALGIVGAQARVEQMIASLDEPAPPDRGAAVGAYLLLAAFLILAPLPALLGS